MKKTALVSMIFLAAACSSQPSDDPVAGNWKQTATIKSVSLPGAPPAMQKMAQAMIGKVETRDSCMSQAEAKLGVRNMAQQMQDGQCTTSDFTSGSGKLSGKIACKSGKNSQSNMTINGTYAPEKIDMIADMQTEDASVPGGKVQMQIAMAAVHTGPCKAGK
jgi:hypothetical protein